MLRNLVLRSSQFSRGASLNRFYATEQQDLVVIGGGPGGYVAAIKAGQLGMKVTCIEKRGFLGGTCLNVGCIPSKALLNASHKYEEARHQFPKMGIIVKDISVDVPTMMKQKASAVSGLTSGVEYLFKKNKVGYLKGEGTLKGPNQIEVKLNDGTKQVIEAKNILIATGSEVTPVPGVEVDEEFIVSSTGALSLKSVPKKMIVIGAGVIGLELGSVWSRLGAEVSFIEFTDRIATGSDLEIANEFKKILEKQKLKFELKHKVTSAKRVGDKVEVVIEPVDGGAPRTETADVVLVCVGRRSHTQNLGLENVGLQVNKRGQIEVNDHFVTSIPSIRAIGDVIRGPMLAHKAEEEGIAAVENIVNEKAGHVNYQAVPSVVYTHPEVAWVGATEEDLKAQKVDYKVGKFPLKANSRARTNNDSEGLIKFLCESNSDKILGVHMLCANAGEMIAEAVLGIEYGASSEDIARTCHAHPTITEAVKEAAMAVQGQSIHF